MVRQFLITFLSPPALSEGGLGALAFFSTPADRIAGATEGPAARRQLRPGPERGPGGRAKGPAARCEGSGSLRRTEMDEQHSTGSIGDL